MKSERIFVIEINKIKEGLCDNCKFNKTFICNKRILKELDKYLPFSLEVYKTNLRNIKLVIESYSYVLLNHRKGKYFTFNFTPFHCSQYTEKCKCDEMRCWNFKEIPSRKLARCIKILGIDIDNIKELDGIDLGCIFFIIDFTNSGAI